MTHGGDHGLASISDASSELHPARYYPSTQSNATWRIDRYSAAIMPGSTDIASNGENVFSISSGAGTPNFGHDKMFPRQRFSSAHSTHAPMILGLGSVDPIDADNAQTIFADHTGTDASCFPSSGIQSSGGRHASSQCTLKDKELLGHASSYKGMPDSPALYPPREVAHGLLETQYRCLVELRDYPQLSLEPINRRATNIISQCTTSPKQAIRGRTGLHSCNVCGDRFAQLQGARRHHREKHEPEQCPHCHAFRWGRLYLFKRHLKSEHPEIDPKAAILDATRRNRSKGASGTGVQAFRHIPLPEFTSGRHRFDDTKCQPTSFPPTQSKSSPASPPIGTYAGIPDRSGEDARAGTLALSQRVETSHRWSMARRRRSRDSGAITSNELFRAFEEN